MNNSKHPIWPLLRLVVLMATLTGVLYLNASSFDNTEIKTIVTMFIIASGTETVSSLFSRASN